MATPIEMPKLGNSVEECLIARWHKQEGDTVLQGDILAEIETDKATFELTASVSGTLLGTFCGFYSNGPEPYRVVYGMVDDMFAHLMSRPPRELTPIRG